MVVINLLSKFINGVLITLTRMFKNPPFFVKLFLGLLAGMVIINGFELFINYLYDSESYKLVPIKTSSGALGAHTAILPTWPAPLLNKGHKMFVSSWVTLYKEPNALEDTITDIVQIGDTQPKIIITSDRTVQVEAKTMDGTIHTIVSGATEIIPLEKSTFVAFVINKNNMYLYINDKIVVSKNIGDDIFNIAEGPTKVSYGTSFDIGMIHNIYSGNGGMIDRGMEEIKDKTEPGIDSCGNTL